ncbi:unnamed protein product [Pleuronectes platessa]|uniref:Uncharacterized protein n=1 Tax=Pleuronectes platessa TaxID=8262 RepID=A0A9N7TUU3_PLEPL|nr:unnamed protein product [Pleuronectes platessa]
MAPGTCTRFRAPPCTPDAQRGQVALPAGNCEHVPAACTVGAMCTCQTATHQPLLTQHPSTILNAWHTPRTVTFWNDLQRLRDPQRQEEGGRRK